MVGNCAALRSLSRRHCRVNSLKGSCRLAFFWGGVVGAPSHPQTDHACPPERGWQEAPDCIDCGQSAPPYHHLVSGVNYPDRLTTITLAVFG